MAVTKRLRYEILRRDNHTCRYCGSKAPDTTLTIDHVTPKALGGTDHPDNLVAACHDCNAGKTSTPADAPLVADVRAADVAWKRSVRAALDAMDEEHAMIDSQVEAVRDLWDNWHDQAGETVPKDQDWAEGVAMLLRRGLSIEHLGRAIRIAMQRPGVANINRWRYFCGICWRTLDDAQRLAAEQG